jgi:hypothetical protein
VRAVVESHGGTVTLEQSTGGHGTRFLIMMPLEGGPAPVTDVEPSEPGVPTNGAPQTSTTTGSTIGRRRSRS